MYKKMKNNFTHQKVALSALLMTLSFDLLAALPTPVAPSLGKPQGDWLTLIKGYIKDGGLSAGFSGGCSVFFVDCLDYYL